MGIIFESLFTSFDSIKDECIVYAANKDNGPMGDNPYDNHPWF